LGLDRSPPRLKHRVPNDRGGYDGGPIYFLKAAFKVSWIPFTVASLLCVYGIEVYQFNILTNCLSQSWNLDTWIIAPVLLILVLFAGLGGIKRISKICSTFMPAFVLIFVAMAFWIVFQEIHLLPGIFATVFKSAFQGHAAVGGFAGSSILLAIQHGTSKAAYSSDLGIGYDSIIQSESSTVHPEKQASLAIIGVFIDNFICTLSILIVLITGLWTSPTIPIPDLMRSSLSIYFPFMEVFMPTFLFMTGYTTIIAYLCVGLKCARFLNKKVGEKIYIGYACLSFIFFSFFDPWLSLLVMSLSGALLLIFNLLGIIKLRDQVTFSISSAPLPEEPRLEESNS
jgi:alanine or glycine:cation symporter, AGCS family